MVSLLREAHAVSRRARWFGSTNRVCQIAVPAAQQVKGIGPHVNSDYNPESIADATHTHSYTLSYVAGRSAQAQRWLFVYRVQYIYSNHNRRGHRQQPSAPFNLTSRQTRRTHTKYNAHTYTHTHTFIFIRTEIVVYLCRKKNNANIAMSFSAVRRTQTRQPNATDLAGCAVVLHCTRVNALLNVMLKWSS